MKTESYINALGFYVLDPIASIRMAILVKESPRGVSNYYHKLYCERSERKAIISRSILIIHNKRTARSVVAWLRTHRVLNPVEVNSSSFPVAVDRNKCIALFEASAPLKDS